MGGKQGRKKRNWLPLQLAAAMPLATLALAALAARLAGSCRKAVCRSPRA